MLCVSECIYGYRVMKLIKSNNNFIRSVNAKYMKKNGENKEIEELLRINQREKKKES